MDFEYIAIDKSKKEVKGLINADSIKDAKQKLKESGLLIIKIQEYKKDIFSFKSYTIKDEELYRISKEFAVLLNSGIVLDRAIIMVRDSLESEKLKNFMDDILKEVRAGKSLSLAFEEKKMFDPLIITMLKVGETIGNLKDSFDNIAQYTEFRVKFRNDIRNAMAYPMFLIAASFLTLLAIFKIIIPKFFSIFGSEPKNLPLLSKILYTTSKNLTTRNEIIFIGFLVILYVISKYLKLNISEKISNYSVKLPLIKNLILQIELSKFCYAMYSMLKNGVEFIKALDLSKNIIKNKYIASEISKTIPKIKQGESISSAFESVKFLPPIMIGMIKVGEESANMKDMFYELYSLFNERLNNTIKKLLVLVEPTIITIMGLIVGSIVVSLMLTVMSVSNIKL